MAGTEITNMPGLRSDSGNAVRLAKALKRLSDEHGLPNAFRASEVASLAGLIPMQVGRLCNNHFTRPRVVDECKRLGIRFRRIEKRSDGSYLIVENPADA